jgi:hypothetical protein
MRISLPDVRAVILLGRWADFAGGKVGHEQEEEGVGGNMKVEINQAVY